MELEQCQSKEWAEVFAWALNVAKDLKWTHKGLCKVRPASSEEPAEIAGASYRRGLLAFYRKKMVSTQTVMRKCIYRRKWIGQRVATYQTTVKFHARKTNKTMSFRYSSQEGRQSKLACSTAAEQTRIAQAPFGPVAVGPLIRALL